MKSLLADINLAPVDGYKGFGPLGLEGLQPGMSTAIFTRTISLIVGVMTIIAAIWFTFTLITGAIGLITGGGDKAALEASRRKITTGLIGLVIVIVAVFIVDILGFLLGFPRILNIDVLLWEIAPVPVGPPPQVP